jgi:hypothetical protein
LDYFICFVYHLDSLEQSLKAEGGVINIRVYDMAAQLIQTASLVVTNGTTVLPLTTLSVGIYNLQIELNDQIKYSKFIKL